MVLVAAATGSHIFTCLDGPSGEPRQQWVGANGVEELVMVHAIR